MAIDVIVGGPPCQAFARVGRSKLREIEEHPEAFKRDPRARLYLEYLHYVDAFQPLAVLMENVPDVLNHGGQNIAEEICEVLEEKGYVCGYTLLNAAYYGVPQTRERMFLIAYRREVAKKGKLPRADTLGRIATRLRWHSGGSTQAAQPEQPSGRIARLHPASHSIKELPAAVTAEEAIGDLPPIYAREQLKAGTLRRGARRFDVPLRYDGRKISTFAELMRNWPGFMAPEALLDHVIPEPERNQPPTPFSRARP